MSLQTRIEKLQKTLNTAEANERVLTKENDKLEKELRDELGNAVDLEEAVKKLEAKSIKTNAKLEKEMARLEKECGQYVQ